MANEAGELEFLQSVLQRTEPVHVRSIWLLWALIVLCGGVVTDVRPEWTGGYWMVAGPGGGILSGWFGHRHHERVGQLNAAEGRRHMEHWGILLVATALAPLLVWVGAATPAGLGSIELLLVGVAYALAGVHLERGFGWVSLAIAAAYLVTLFASFYEWTIGSVTIAAALVVCALRRS